ncbi:MAG TPA: acyl-CoA dehydrogenase [Haliangiales bacterium]|nr:acyl-CoA dehydrogenase [Haliangiales bacterium]
MTQALNRYRANLRELKFVLFEQLGLDDVLGKEPYAAWGRAEVEMVVEEIDRFVREVLGPLNPVGDRVGCKIVDGHVVTPPGYKEAWTKLYAGGWKTIAVSEAHGGQGAPRTLHAVVEEFLSGANAAFTMYPGLTEGAAELLAAFGTPDQKARYLGKMFSGTWAGTMCLTEPQAGSDVGAATTSARKLPDGTYAIKGTKIYISCGDHDLAENIIHMVLARIDGAPPGTKGLSLFIVPKNRVDASGAIDGGNDVVTASIEHKLGINGSATAVLQFGENDRCVGELVGGVEHSGMMQMFRMMNGARIGVALQGLALGSTAYLNAVDYAKERKQGPHYTQFKDAHAPRVPIIDHPDVRRMLLDMKSRVEGIRALILKLALHQDKATQLRGKDDAKAAYHQGQIDLLVPIVKAYASDQAFRVCETALQTFGGAGYLKDHPVEQYLRDSKIFSIYEGTNHIQAMDLVGRKLPQNAGANLRAFLADVGGFVAAHGSHPTIGPEVAALGQAAEALSMVAGHFLAWLSERKLGLVPLAANRFLEMMAETAVGWLLLDGARVADAALAKLPSGDSHSDRAFYEGKVKGALYFARNVLPMVYAKAKVLATEDMTALDMPEASF